MTTAEDRRYRILIVDDVPSHSIRNLLRDLGHEVLEAGSSLSGLELLSPPDLVRRLPDPKRLRAFMAERNDWRSSRRARGRKS